MFKWVTVGILSLQAMLSPAAGFASDVFPNPVTRSDFPSDPMSTILLGRDLFHDPILSGNRNIACATCHHATLGSGDGVALGLGEGGAGLGPARHGQPGYAARAHVPRNAPALFNLGAAEFDILFHDGRVSRDATAQMGFAMPPGAALERPLPSALAAQAMMPVTSPEEMAGAPGENDIADLVARGRLRGPDGAWQTIARRVESVPAYRRRFDAITGPGEPLHMADIASALAAFIAHEFRACESPFDAFLKGRRHALTPPQQRGAALFYGKARCAACHAGPFQTDHDFHAIGMPQIGPGKPDALNPGAPFSDHGRAGITGNPADLYRFRTPSLRNVALTAPYGHSGAYPTLESVVRHHLAPRESLLAYDPAQIALPGLDGTAPAMPPLPGPEEIARIAAAIEIVPPRLSEAEIADILAFLNALTDSHAALGRLGAPARVPSGLAVDPLTPR